MASSTLRNLPYIFDRPSEPLFTGRDDVSFQIPTDILPERYKSIASAIQTRFPSTSTVVPVQKFQGQPPNLSDVTNIGRHTNFSIFNPYHRSCAVKLIEIFMNASNVDQFLSSCVYARERVNPYMFVYCASVAILHREDTKNIVLPSHVEIFPKLYMDSAVFSQAVEENAIVPSGSRMPIEVPRDYTASDLDEEHRVAYWREDIGINLHHWHWHLVYPFDGPRNIVNKDRRGELFYYMHQQIIARYNFERLCNGLARVRRLNHFRDPIPEAYFPKLDSSVASRNWPARQANSTLKDLSREVDQLRVDVQDLERWRDRLLNSIYEGYVTGGDGQRYNLTETEGIDILGNLMENSLLSVNRNLYGDIHNMGHIMLAYVHDPDNRYLENFGLMGDPSTAMRDPVFYAWHAFMDDVFQQHKGTLTPYSVQQLSFDNVRVLGIDVITEGVSNNTFLTFWQQNDIDLSRGLDFQPRGSVYARLTHLQHAPFTYRIRVENSGQQRTGTVRVFLAPRNDERSNAFLFRDQRGLFIELDKFTVNLRNGTNNIERRSSESNVTIPYEQTFRNLSPGVRPTGGTALENFNFCGCGWPDHVLVPRGNVEGFVCDLFVMISDARNDTVQQDQNVQSPGCDDAQSYCGLMGGRYPDRKAMGFPLDRNPRSGVTTMSQFLTSNMFVQTTTIRFSNRVVPATGNQMLTNRPTTGQGTQQGQGNRPTTGQGTRPTTSQGTQQGQSTRPTSQGTRPTTGQSTQQAGGTRPTTGPGAQQGPGGWLPNRGQGQQGGSSRPGNKSLNRESDLAAKDLEYVT